MGREATFFRRVRSAAKNAWHQRVPCNAVGFVFNPNRKPAGGAASTRLPSARSTASPLLTVAVVLHLIVMRVLHEDAAHAGGRHA